MLRTREDPPFSGPAAAIHAGLECIAADCERSQVLLPEWCLILGVDTPRIAPAVQQLIAAARAADQASVGQSAPLVLHHLPVLGVAEGIYQPLVGIYRFEAIRSVFSTGTTDASVHSFAPFAPGGGSDVCR